jgi:hypothetical protein
LAACAQPADGFSELIRPSVDDVSSESGWSAQDLSARWQDRERRLRYPAGSPNDAEIAAYASCLPAGSGSHLAVVLGMTPELRTLALHRFARVVSVDHSETAIHLLGDWVDPVHRVRELIVRSEWTNISRLLSAKALGVLGDGVFGNLPNLDAWREMLHDLRELLAPGGALILRQALLPRGFTPGADTKWRLLERFRAGEIDEFSFGLGWRLLGHHDTCYDPARALLDSAAIVQATDLDVAAGRLSQEEYDRTRRFAFGGTNILPGEEAWERMLREAAYEWRTVPLSGRDWYRYYKMYACTPARDA